MTDNPLSSLGSYSQFIAKLLERHEVIQNAEKLYWYDDFPHPNDPTLASTHPHHKHVTPNIKRNRIPAPDISFDKPNLPQIIHEIEEKPANTTSDEL